MSKPEVFSFLDSLRESGVTNMFGAGPYIQEVFGCSKSMARDLVLEWMESNRNPVGPVAIVW